MSEFQALRNGVAEASYPPEAMAERAAPWLKSYPPDVIWNVSFKGWPLPDILDRTAAAYGHLTCTYFFGATLTYREIGALVNKAAKGLQQLGVKKGVHVGLLLPNCPYFIILYYAILKTGATVVNYNPLYTIEELTGQIQDSRTSIMVTLDLKAIYPKVETLLASGVLAQAIVCPFTKLLPPLKAVLFRLIKGSEIVKLRHSPQAAKIVPYAKLIDNRGDYTPVTIDPDNDLAVLQYTGGTTGTPKGAMLTHSNLTINLQQVATWDPSIGSGKEAGLALLPFFHVFAMTALMNLAIYKAAKLVLVPRFDLNMALKLIRKTRPTLMPGVPTVFNAMMNSPKLKKTDLASLRFCISGGAPLPGDVQRGFERTSGCKLVEGYGLSETSPVATCNPVNRPGKEGSIGLPMPGTRLSLRSLDDPRQEVPLGEKGEICIAGPQVMKGYWNRPEETAGAFVGEFFRTGDVGIMDADGFTFIVDRIKDIIICSGFNVYPRRIEEAIYEHPAVEEVTVIGIPDGYRGEAPKAYIKLRTGQTATAEDIRKFLEPKISKIEMPSQIEFRDQLPKTLVGKLSKKELKAELEKR